MKHRFCFTGDTVTTACCRSLRWVLLLGLLFCSACETGIYHTVREGQTLYRISHTYGVDETYLARVNGIGDPAHLQIGTRLFIPGADRVRSVAVVDSGSADSTGQPPPRPTSRPPATPKTEVTAPEKPAPAPQKRSASRAPRQLQWPLRGEVVRSFSARAQAGSGRGIEIAVAEGSAVVAAEAGKVIYSGNGVAGYGYLVILQHTDELFTVYGFNRKNLVSQGRFVSRGEKIALSGTPPSGGRPRLHFEVRKGKQPVDPLTYLR